MTDKPVVRIKILSDIVFRSSWFHQGDSGLDLSCPEEMVVAPRWKAYINFGIAVDAGRSFWLLPRSSIAKTPLRMANSIGLIDAGYRGPLIACVDNISDEPYRIQAGIRLFQIALPSLEQFNIEIVEELDETTRGAGGFGSSGI